jgi:hypothetical protein
MDLTPRLRPQSPPTPRPIVRAVLVGATVACSACAGTLEDPGRFSEGGTAGADGGGSSGGSDGGAAGDQGAPPGDGGCPDIPTLFVSTCTASGCHNPSDKAQGLDLQSPNVATRLVGVCSTESKGELIDPTNPSASLIYTKLTASPPFGARMPFLQTPLSAATIACVLTWASQQMGDAGACGQ